VAMSDPGLMDLLGSSWIILRNFKEFKRILRNSKELRNFEEF
jgi:hypothetical protein